jgi:phenylalanyl-tRNA synthetase alpha chain
MTDTLAEIIDELSNNEKKVLLTLQKIGKNATPEYIVKNGGFKQLVEVMNAASWLQAKNLVKINEELNKYYSIGKKQLATKDLPERRVLKLLDKNDGPITIDELKSTKKLKHHEIPIALGWLKRKGWADISKLEGETIIELNERGEQALKKKGKDEDLILKLVDAGELVSTEVDNDVITQLKSRKNLIKEREVISRSIELTELGHKVLDAGIKIKEQVAQLTPELLQSGKWAEYEYRKYDINTFAPAIYGGKKHPLQQIIQDIRRIFVEMGFEEVEYDFIQSCFWNMDALFVAQDHPVRDLQDTFYMDEPSILELPEPEVIKRVKEMHEHGGETESKGWNYEWRTEDAEKALLRTHTTVNSIRYLSEHPDSPVKVFTIGRNFRNEAIDSTHTPEFYQIEGIVMEEHASFRMLLGILKEFYQRMGFEEIRFRPAYFPYTEPSAEVIVKFQGKWLELGGSGVFRPEVLEPFNIKHPVLAWGLGLERLAMKKLGLDDIRTIYLSDIDWLRQTPII